MADGQLASADIGAGHRGQCQYRRMVTAGPGHKQVVQFSIWQQRAWQPFELDGIDQAIVKVNTEVRGYELGGDHKVSEADSAIPEGAGNARRDSAVVATVHRESGPCRGRSGGRSDPTDDNIELDRPGSCAHCKVRTDPGLGPLELAGDGISLERHSDNYQ